jgi:ribose transport system substrate-binding protein
MRSRRVVHLLILAVVMATLIGSAALTVQSTPAAQASAKVYKIYLGNPFVGNDWRVQMQNDAKILAQKAPLKGRVDLRIDNGAGNTVPAQIASLNNIIQTHPDAIVLEAASATGSNAVIQRACSMGILVITFDSVATAPCAWKVSANWDFIARTNAEWLAKTINYKGNLFIDHGIAGVALADQLYKGAVAVFKKYKGIHIVGNFYSQFALGPEQSSVASLLSAHPNVDGIYTEGYGVGGLRALKNAGHKLVPVAAYSYNITTVSCLRLKAPCLAAATPAWISGLAMKLAVQALDGKISKSPRTFYNPTVFFETNGVKIPGAQISPIKVGVSAFPNQPNGLFVPVSAPWAHITPKQALTGNM